MKLLLVDYKWLVTFVLAATAFILGIIGYAKANGSRHDVMAMIDYLYMTIQLFMFRFSGQIPAGDWELNVARYLAPMSSSYAFVVFVLIFFYDRLKLFWYDITGNHVVVCGLGYLGQKIARNLYDDGYSVVAIEKDPANPDIELCRELGILVITGDAFSTETLRKARIYRAKYVFIVAGNDGLNSDIAAQCHKLTGKWRRKGVGSVVMGLAGKSEPLNCFVHIVEPRIYTFLKAKQLGANDELFRLEFFNTYQTAGQYIIKDLFSGLPEKPPMMHIAVIGIGRMGESLIYHAIKRWHDRYAHTGARLTITMVGLNAHDQKNILRSRYPSLDNSGTLIDIDMDVTSAKFYDGGFLLNSSGICDIDRIFFCIDDESVAMSAALYLNQRLSALNAQNRLVHPDLKITVRTRHTDGFATLLSQALLKSDLPFDRIEAFPLIDKTCDTDVIVRGLNEQIAMALHEEYCDNRRRAGETVESNSSLQPWAKLPETLKRSNREQTDNIREKLKDIGCDITALTDWEEPPFEFTAGEIEFLAEKEHERIVIERLRNGYVPGPRDTLKKTSPYLVPYDQLSDDVKDIDRNFIKKLPAVLNRVDLKIIRLQKSMMPAAPEPQIPTRQ